MLWGDILCLYYCPYEVKKKRWVIKETPLSKLLPVDYISSVWDLFMKILYFTSETHVILEKCIYSFYNLRYKSYAGIFIIPQIVFV